MSHIAMEIIFFVKQIYIIYRYIISEQCVSLYFKQQLFGSLSLLLSGGIFFQVSDSIDSNALTDAFASLTTSDGTLTQQVIQVRKNVKS